MRKPTPKGVPPGPSPLSVANGGPVPPHMREKTTGIKVRKKYPATNKKTVQLHWSAPNPKEERKRDLNSAYPKLFLKMVPHAIGIIRPPSDTLAVFKDVKLDNSVVKSLSRMFKRVARKPKPSEIPKRLGKRPSCLGPQLSQKWTIILSVLRKMYVNYPSLKKAILNCAISVEEISLLLEIIPSQEPSKRNDEWIEATTKTDAFVAANPKVELYPDERFVKLLASIPNLRFRLECMAAKANFKSHMASILAEIGIFEEAISYLRYNEMFSQLLSFILKVGNILNDETSFGQKDWFKLSSLEKVLELQCLTEGEEGRRNGNRRTLLSFVAMHVGSVIGEGLSCQKKAMEIKIVHPLSQLRNLQDVFAMLETLKSNSSDHSLCQKRRLSLQMNFSDSDDNITDINMAGIDSDDHFVEVFLEFLDDNKDILQRGADRMTQLLQSYIDLCYYFGMGEEFLPIDALDSDGQTVKDVFHYTGRFLSRYEDEVKQEAAAKRRNEECRRIQKVRALRQQRSGNSESYDFIQPVSPGSPSVLPARTRRSLENLDRAMGDVEMLTTPELENVVRRPSAIKEPKPARPPSRLELGGLAVDDLARASVLNATTGLLKGFHKGNRDLTDQLTVELSSTTGTLKGLQNWRSKKLGGDAQGSSKLVQIAQHATDNYFNDDTTNGSPQIKEKEPTAQVGSGDVPLSRRRKVELEGIENGGGGDQGGSEGAMKKSRDMLVENIVRSLNYNVYKSENVSASGPYGGGETAQDTNKMPQSKMISTTKSGLLEGLQGYKEYHRKMDIVSAIKGGDSQARRSLNRVVSSIEDETDARNVAEDFRERRRWLDKPMLGKNEWVDTSVTYGSGGKSRLFGGIKSWNGGRVPDILSKGLVGVELNKDRNKGNSIDTINSNQTDVVSNSLNTFPSNRSTGCVSQGEESDVSCSNTSSLLEDQQGMLEDSTK